MSSTLALALQISAVDMFSGVLNKLRGRLQSLGKDARHVQRDFDLMQKNITAGLKALAVSAYAINKIKPGVSAAGDMQEALLGIKQELAGGATSAEKLARRMADVRQTAVQVSSNLPFSAEDVVKIETSLVKAGLKLKDITGKSGAAFSAAALAALTKQAPETIGKSLANIGAQFNFRGADYKAASDWMVRVASAAAVDVPELISGLRMAGSSAAALGVDFKDTATALATLAPLGELAGSSLNRFLAGVKGNTPQAARLMKQLNLSFFDKGRFVGMEEAVNRLRVAMAKIPDQQQRMLVLQQMFGEEGQRAALMFLQSKKGFQDIEKSAHGALSMAQKLAIWGSGLNASMEKLSGTARSTLATLFDPLLGPLTEAVNKMNELTGAFGAFAEKHKTISQAVSLGVGGLAAAGLTYGLGRIARGGFAGAKVLKGLFGKGAASTAAGIAKGKAIEAATGVQPVFVTNWPDGLGGVGVAAEAVAAGAGRGWLSKLKTWTGKMAPFAARLGTSLGGIASTPVAAGIGSFGAGAGRGWLSKLKTWTGKMAPFAARLGTSLGGIASTPVAAGIGSFGAGFGVGSLINKYLIDGTKLGDAIGEGLNRIAAALGSQESRLAIEINHRGETRVRKMETKGMQLDVSTGPIPVGAP